MPCFRPRFGKYTCPKNVHVYGGRCPSIHLVRFPHDIIPRCWILKDCRMNECGMVREKRRDPPLAPHSASCPRFDILSLCSGFNTTCPSAVRNGKFIEIVRIPRRARLASSSNSLGYHAVSASDGVYGSKRTGNPITSGCHVAFMRHSFPQRAISAGGMGLPQHLLVLGMSSGKRNGYSWYISASHLFSAKLFQCILSSSARCIRSIPSTSSSCTSIPGVSTTAVVSTQEQ